MVKYELIKETKDDTLLFISIREKVGSVYIDKPLLDLREVSNNVDTTRL